jgi:hypothetical protein
MLREYFVRYKIKKVVRENFIYTRNMKTEQDPEIFLENIKIKIKDREGYGVSVYDVDIISINKI